jgi:allophanate hydrolase
MTRTTMLVVAGAHLAGQPLHPYLVGLGAALLRTTTTAPVYRMVALPASAAVRELPAVPPRPGLIRSGADGAALEVEVYRLPVAALGTLMLTVAPPLAIGSVLLADGSEVPGFVCEGYASDEAPDITHLGGWRGYLEAG